MFKAATYRVVLASPSELSEERQVATDAINEWNAQHAAAESVVLLPVKWETHSVPTSGKRPQQAINEQLIHDSDILVGLFWTKMGTSTGVAESGTVEEVNQFVAAGKPAMLYFSSRPIDPNKIDVSQHRKLKAFKAQTYKKALVGSFSTLTELHSTLLRDLTNQIRLMRPRRQTDKLSEAERITALITSVKKSNISPEDFERYRDTFLRRKNMKPNKGPNGYPTGYDDEGNFVEWLPEEEDDPSGPWPMILRRSDEAISEAHAEFWDKVWYNRHMVGHERDGIVKHDPKLPGCEPAMKLEKKYGKKNLQFTDFKWGLISGKLSALAWVQGAEWEESLDT